MTSFALKLMRTLSFIAERKRATGRNVMPRTADMEIP
jgi:hypothetical protein